VDLLEMQAHMMTHSSGQAARSSDLAGGFGSDGGERLHHLLIHLDAAVVRPRPLRAPMRNPVEHEQRLAANQALPLGG